MESGHSYFSPIFKVWGVIILWQIATFFSIKGYSLWLKFIWFPVLHQPDNQSEMQHIIMAYDFSERKKKPLVFRVSLHDFV